MTRFATVDAVKQYIWPSEVVEGADEDAPTEDAPADTESSGLSTGVLVFRILWYLFAVFFAVLVANDLIFAPSPIRLLGFLFVFMNISINPLLMIGIPTYYLCRGLANMYYNYQHPNLKPYEQRFFLPQIYGFIPLVTWKGTSFLEYFLFLFKYNELGNGKQSAEEYFYSQNKDTFEKQLHDLVPAYSTLVENGQYNIKSVLLPKFTDHLKEINAAPGSVLNETTSETKKNEAVVNASKKTEVISETPATPNASKKNEVISETPVTPNANATKKNETAATPNANATKKNETAANATKKNEVISETPVTPNANATKKNETAANATKKNETAANATKKNEVISETPVTPNANATKKNETAANATKKNETAANATKKNEPANTTPANATPANATPANATPANATPANATPANATPANATPANATPANATAANANATKKNETAANANATKKNEAVANVKPANQPK